MRRVIDASVIVEWFVAEEEGGEHSEDALEVLQAVRRGDIEVIQPIHWQVEVLAVLARLRPAVITSIQGMLEALSFEVWDDSDVHACGVRIAINYRQHLFDTLYHAVALETGAMLITADKKYVRAAHAEGGLLLLG